jgi:hypothetical protein
MHGEVRNAYKVQTENLNGTDRFGDLGVDSTTILKWFLKRQGVKMWTGFMWLKKGTSGGLL